MSEHFTPPQKQDVVERRFAVELSKAVRKYLALPHYKQTSIREDFLDNTVVGRINRSGRAALYSLDNQGLGSNEFKLFSAFSPLEQGIPEDYQQRKRENKLSHDELLLEAMFTELEKRDAEREDAEDVGIQKLIKKNKLTNATEGQLEEVMTKCLEILAHNFGEKDLDKFQSIETGSLSVGDPRSPGGARLSVSPMGNVLLTVKPSFDDPRFKYCQASKFNSKQFDIKNSRNPYDLEFMIKHVEYPTRMGMYRNLQSVADYLLAVERLKELSKVSCIKE